MEEYIESIQICFEENGLEPPSKEVCEAVVECIRAVDEMFSYGTPSPIDFQNAETERLKQRISELENERDSAIGNFKKNVAMRNNCGLQDVILGDDGYAEIRV